MTKNEVMERLIKKLQNVEPQKWQYVEAADEGFWEKTYKTNVHELSMEITFSGSHGREISDKNYRIRVFEVNEPLEEFDGPEVKKLFNDLGEKIEQYGAEKRLSRIKDVLERKD